MEVYLINYELAREFWLDKIQFDSEFFDTLWNSYKKDLYNLYKKIDGHDIVTIFPFSVPGEIIDFLDGNGLIFEYDNDHNLRITLM